MLEPGQTADYYKNNITSDDIALSANQLQIKKHVETKFKQQHGQSDVVNIDPDYIYELLDVLHRNSSSAIDGVTIEHLCYVKGELLCTYTCTYPNFLAICCLIL